MADAHSDRHQTSVALSGPVLVLISAQRCSRAAILRGEWKYHLFSVEADFVWGTISINGGRGQLIFPLMQAYPLFKQGRHIKIDICF